MSRLTPAQIRDLPFYRLDVHGVPGAVSVSPNPDAPGLFDHQRWISEPREFTDSDGDRVRMRVTLRFDDDCGNGHNSFAATVSGKVLGHRHGGEIGGCAHEEVAIGFPELAHLLPWHGCTTSGPIHYVQNTLYFAGDRDCLGLRKGEKRQIRNGKTGELAWKLETEDGRPLYQIEQYANGDTPPEETPQLRWVPWCRIGEGKERDLDAARRAARWPDADDATLCMDPEDLQAALEARLTSLLREFKQVIEDTGFYWQ